ncbi:hypothetical protein T4A_10400 [Trichinella pseudospiralis]|uniref:Uncharacterized protein n=1 Tax=Trichinella pseudospiralis TaxID=6337 RepID=A0A0V1EZ65_TRIPS|nr:hypothetical protein T4E_7932 [Trichinella pseudospiralis]KRY79145.1 hypothetical protein T4A_10400 [Trichinella pseudospiralis]KRY91393.1 hypothetical protein T4D_2029 [Trichinella pseudospiralis]
MLCPIGTSIDQLTPTNGRLCLACLHNIQSAGLGAQQVPLAEPRPPTSGESSILLHYLTRPHTVCRQDSSLLTLQITPGIYRNVGRIKQINWPLPKAVVASDDTWRWLSSASHPQVVSRENFPRAFSNSASK